MNRKVGFVFEPYRLDAADRSLTRDGQALAVTPKEFDTLLVLIEAGGRLVTKEELLRRVWPDSYVGEGSLTRNISVLRKVLGEDMIETVPRSGYRFLKPVTVVSVPTAIDPVKAHPTTPPAALPEVAVRPPVPGASAPSRRGPSRWLVYGTFALLLVFIALLFGRTDVSHAGIKPQPGPVRIAILPFNNYTGDAQNDYLSDGMTEATISELSRLSPGQLGVIARTSAMKYKNTDKAIPEIARELNADYILESSVRGSGERMRVTTQLVRGSDASHVWTGEYERRLQNVLDVQQQIAIAVAQEIRLKLDASVTARLQRTQTVDAETYQDYLLGRFYLNKRNREGLFKSVDYFERALQRDPNYARAYAGLADSYLVLGGGYMNDIEAYNKARDAARKALELDNTLSDAYTSLAYEKFVNEHDMAGADDDYQRALALDPGSANAHHWYAMYLSAMQRHEEAIVHINRAMELDPLAVAPRYNAGWIYLTAGRRDEAERYARQALEIDPNCAPAHGTMAATYESEGRYDQAITEFQTAQKIRAEYSAYAVEVAHVYAMEGKKDQARKLVASLLADPHWGAVAPYSFSVTYAALGQTDQAFRWLQRCVDDHSCTASEINNDHGLDPLRSDPRFSQIAR